MNISQSLLSGRLSIRSLRQRNQAGPQKSIASTWFSVLGLAAALTAPVAQGADVNWLGGSAGATTDFNLGTNWLGGSLPAYYDETTSPSGAIVGDQVVFDGTIVGGVNNKTPTMTAAFGNGANGSTQWGLLGVSFIDSGWTLDTGSNTLYVSWRGTRDLYSGATSGTNTVNGNVRLGARDTNDFSDIFVAAGGTLRINGTLGVAIDGGSNTAGSINKTGSGLLELNTNNAYRMVVKEGTLKLVAETAGGFTGDGSGGVGTGNNITVRIEGGKLDVNGARSNLGIGTLSLIGGELTNSSSTNETVSLRPTSNQTLAGLISGNLNMNYGANATNTTTISNANTYTGTTTIANSSGGGSTNTVVVTSAAAFGNATSAITLGSTGNSGTHARLLTDGAIEIDRDITLAGGAGAAAPSSVKTLGSTATQTADSTFSGDITVGTASGAGAANSNLTLTAQHAAATVHFTGNIVEHANPTVGILTIVGPGTVRLTGNNTYAGGTTVSSGTLLVDNIAGSGTGTGTVTVLVGATLGGEGSISGATTVNGNLAPGNSPGTLNFSSDLTLAATANSIFEINGVTEGSLYDSVIVQGNMLYDGVLTLNFGYTPAGGAVFDLFDFSGQSGTFTSINVTGASGTFNYGNGTFTVVPEPSSSLLLMAGVGLYLTAMRRRRMR